MTIRQKITTLIILLTVVFASISFGFFITRFIIHVSGESMMPTLHNNDYVYGEPHPKLANIKKGDIIVFKDRNHWDFNNIYGDKNLSKKEKKEFLIKRVVAMPGDKVSFDNNGIISVNGVRVKDDSKFYRGCPKVSGDNYFKNKSFIVPAKHVFVRGDNVNNSKDSRFIYCYKPELRYLIYYDNIILKVKNVIKTGKILERFVN